MKKLLLMIMFIITVITLSCEKEPSCKHCEKIVDYIDSCFNTYMEDENKVIDLGCVENYELLNSTTTYGEYFDYAVPLDLNESGIVVQIRERCLYICD